MEKRGIKLFILCSLIIFLFLSLTCNVILFYLLYSNQRDPSRKLAEKSEVSSENRVSDESDLQNGENEILSEGNEPGEVQNVSLTPEEIYETQVNTVVQPLIGEWKDGTNETIYIYEDGSFLWVNMTRGDNPTVFSCLKGYTDGATLIGKRMYAVGSVFYDTILYADYREIPDSEFEEMNNFYRIDWYGIDAIGLSTPTRTTGYRFVRQ